MLDSFATTGQEVFLQEYHTTKYNQMIYFDLGFCLGSSVTTSVIVTVSTAVAFVAARPAFVVLVVETTMNVSGVVYLAVLSDTWALGHT